MRKVNQQQIPRNPGPFTVWTQPVKETYGEFINWQYSAGVMVEKEGNFIQVTFTRGRKGPVIVVETYIPSESERFPEIIDWIKESKTLIMPLKLSTYKEIYEYFAILGWWRHEEFLGCEINRRD